MDRRSIVLKSISCRGIKSFNLFQKPSAYAVVSIAVRNHGRLKQKQKQKTSADHECGKNPEWNQTIQFDFDDNDFQDLFLEFAIMAQGNLLLFGDKLIGKSRVPITDLSVGLPSDAFSHVSYQLQSPDGKPNGVLNFSYRLNLPEMELDHGIPSEPPPMDDYTPPPAPATNSLYPPIQLPEAVPEDCFSRLSYQVQSPDGNPNPNGVLRFSYGLNLPEMELDHGIPSEPPPMDDYTPPPAKPTKSLYPPISLPETEQEDCFSHVSYQVQSPDGNPNGVLSFSYGLNLPEMELDHGIPSEPPPMNDYTPPPAPATKGLYSPLPLPETEQEDCFSHVSYQVQSPDGNPNGVLRFSYGLNLPEMELDHGIPSETPMDDYTPPPAPTTKGLYPPLPLPETEPENCFTHVSYQVQSPDGNPNGVLSFSYGLNLPEMELDHGIPSEPPPMNDYTPPPAPATKGLYPSLPLPETEPENCFNHVSYQVQSPEGNPNGVLRFSYGLNLPEMELDHGIPSETPMDDYTPPPVKPTKSLYPPIQLPEAEPEDCFCYYNQPPLPPPPPASRYYPAIDRAFSSPVLNRDAYLSVPVNANAGYYNPPTASIPPAMPDFGAYYRSSAQGSCSYCNYCNCK